MGEIPNHLCMGSRCAGASYCYLPPICIEQSARVTAMAILERDEARMFDLTADWRNV